VIQGLQNGSMAVPGVAEDAIGRADLTKSYVGRLEIQNPTSRLLRMHSGPDDSSMQPSNRRTKGVRRL
jgi:hypothetical protein